MTKGDFFVGSAVALVLGMLIGLVGHSALLSHDCRMAGIEHKLSASDIQVVCK
jgi:hypothetical protein